MNLNGFGDVIKKYTGSNSELEMYASPRAASCGNRKVGCGYVRMAKPGLHLSDIGFMETRKKRGLEIGEAGDNLGL